MTSECFSSMGGECSGVCKYSVMNIGDKVPDLLGKDENGRDVRVSDFAGRKVVLYFYPKDQTAGCTAEACSLRDNYGTLSDLGYAVVGVSVDNEASHRRFKEKNQLPFPLIADVDKQLVTAFGVWAEKKLYGRTYMGTVRTTYILDEEGRVCHIFGPKEIKTKVHGEQIVDLSNKQTE